MVLWGVSQKGSSQIPAEASPRPASVSPPCSLHLCFPPPVSHGRLRVAPCSSTRVHMPDLVSGPTFSCPEKHGRTQRRTHTRSWYPPTPRPASAHPAEWNVFLSTRRQQPLSLEGRGEVPECWGSLLLTTASLSQVVPRCLVFATGPPLLMAPAP